MSDRAEVARREIIESGSALRGHSLNQRRMGLEANGTRKLLGAEHKAERKATRERPSAYDIAAEERRTELYSRIMRAFDGQATGHDRVFIRETIAEFEKPLGDGSVRVTLVEFP